MGHPSLLPLDGRAPTFCLRLNFAKVSFSNEEQHLGKRFQRNKQALWLFSV